MAFVYLHKRLDTNEIFYVGIGLKDDPKHERAYDKRRKAHRCNIVKKAGYKVIILFDKLTPEAAKEAEIAWIKYYGRKDLNQGNLINMTDGGEGTVNLICTKETKFKLSESSKNRIPRNKNKTTTKETKDKIAASLKGKKIGVAPWNKGLKMSKEYCLIVKENCKKRPKVSEQTKIKQSLAKKGKPAHNKGIKMTEEQKAIRREKMRINKEKKNNKNV